MNKKEIKCPNCGNKMIEIIYGMPAPETMEKVEKGELYLGGCEIVDGFDNPVYHCDKCKRNYCKNLKDYEEEQK